MPPNHSLGRHSCREILFLLLFAALPVLGQPANDNFADRTILTGTEISVTGSNVGATREDGEPNANGPGSIVQYVNSVWWSWTAPTNGLVVLQTGASDFATVVEVYTGSALANLILITNADLSLSFDETHAVFRADSGTSYQIVVGGLDPARLPNQDQGTIRLRLSFIEAPANDDLADRIDLGTGDVRISGSNMAATMEPGEVNIYLPPPARSVWWSWTATNAGPVTVTLNRNLDDPDDLPFWLGTRISILAVYTGDELADLKLVASDFDLYAFPEFSQVTFDGVVGRTYRIRVDGTFGLRQPFVLNVAETKPPLLFIVSPELDAEHRAGSTVSLRAEAFDSDGTIEQVKFYLLPDYTNRPITTVLSNRPFATVLSNAPASEYRLSAAATDNSGARVTTIPVQFDVRPSNDDFADRIPFAGSHTSVTGTLANATVEMQTNVVSEGDIWWSWTALEAGMHTFTVTQSYRPSVTIFTGNSPTNLQMVAQSMSGNADPDYFAQTAFAAVAGTTYQIAVASQVTLHGPVTLSVARSVAPTISINSPTNDTRVVVGRPITLDAAASDPDGVVIKVEFIDEFSQQVLGVVTNPPFSSSVTLTNNASTATIRAWATDDDGIVSFSEPVWIYLVPEPGIPPANDDFADRIPLTGSQVTTTGSLLNSTAQPDELPQGWGSVWWEWTAPTNGVYTVGSRATNMYHFLGIYQGTDISGLTLIGGDEADYLQGSVAAQVVLNAVSGIAYAIAAQWYGGTAEELVLNIVPTSPPVVSLTSPTNNARFIVGDVATITAVASDIDGSIERVDFYDGGVLIGSDTNPPYSVNLPLTIGYRYYEVFAQATDSSGVTTRSDEVAFRVDFPPPPNDDFASRVTLSGPFVTAAGNAAWATLEPDEPNPNGRQSSIWWSWTAPQSGTVTMSAPVRALDVFTGSSLATLTLVTNAFAWQDFDYSSKVTFSAQSGTTYQIAVDATDSVTLRIAPTAPPAITLVSPTNGAVFIEGERVTLVAGVGDDGAIVSVDFFVDFRLVGSSTNPPFSLTLTNGIDAGSSYLRARATDDFGVTSFSREVRVTAGLRPPANDAFSARTLLEGFLVGSEVSTIGATREPGEPNPSGSEIGGTVWWSWTPPMSGTAVIAMSGTHSTLVGVYTGTNLTNLVVVAASLTNKINHDLRQLEFEATAGTPYQIAVDSTDGFLNYASVLAIFLDARELGPVERSADGRVDGRFFTTFDETWIVEASADLLNWTAISTNDPVNGTFEFQDNDASPAAGRFYRVKTAR